MRFQLRSLVLIVTSLIALMSSWSYYDQRSSSAASAPQRPRTVATAQQSLVVVVKSHRANLRVAPLLSGRIVMEVQENQRLTVMRAAPSGPWYRVREQQTQVEGLIHGSTIAFESFSVARPAV